MRPIGRNLGETRGSWKCNSHNGSGRQYGTYNPVSVEIGAGPSHRTIRPQDGRPASPGGIRPWIFD